jgi:hypothetical protein
MDKNCTKVTKKDIFVTKNPGFELDKIIDNKKSWIANTETTHRTFNIAKYDGSQAIRYTDYYLEDERQVINTKEIDLDIDIAAAVETDVWCYVSDNPCLLTGETIGTTLCTKNVGRYTTGTTTIYGTVTSSETITGLCITAGTENTKYSCPAGFSATPANDACKKIESYKPVFLGSGSTIIKGDTNADYSTSVRFYDNIQNNASLPVYYPYAGGGALKDQSGGTISILASSTTNTFWVSNGSTTTGRLNVAGISASTSQWLGFSECINITQSGTYYIGIASDDYCRFRVNGKTIVALTGNSGTAPCYTPQASGHQVWSVFPFYLNSGINLIEMEGLNWPEFGQPTCPSGINSAAFAAEIYKPTSLAVLTGATSTGATQANVIFSTINKVGKYYDLSSSYSGGPTTIGYNCPYGTGYSLNKCDAVPSCTRVTTTAITVTPPQSITGYCNEVRAITSSTVVYTYQAGVYSCPVGFSATPFNDICEKITTSAATFNGANGAPITRGDTNSAYGILGTRFYPSIQNSGGLPYTYSGTSTTLTNQTGTAITPITTVNSGTFWNNSGVNRLVDGRLNKVSILDDTTQWLGFSQCINITTPGVYYIGLAADNYCQFSVDGVLVVSLTGNSNNTPITFPIDQTTLANATNFKYWNVFEWNFTSGQHNITMLGVNQSGAAAFGAEIYNPATFNALTAATTEAQIGLIFSTLQQVGSNYNVGSTIGFSCAGSGFVLSDCNPLVAPVCNKYESSAITFTLGNISATATTSGYCRDSALTCVTPTYTSRTDTTTVTTSQTITVSAITCEPKVYCCSTYCGDENININGLMTESLSGITALEDFEYLITSELIDAKDRKTLSSYPTLRLLYERYMNSQAFCNTTSSKFDYYKMDKFASLIGSYWVDLIEQTMPATTIWGATKIYTNTIFDKQKFQYKGYSTFFGINKYRALKPLSPVTGDSCSVDANTVFIKGASSATTLFFNEGDIHQYNNIYPLQMNSGSEFISVVKVIGPKSPCDDPNVINDCLLAASITNNITKDGTITANAVGAIGNVTYLWSPTNETTQTIGNLSAGTTYSVKINDQCCEAISTFNTECGLSVTAVSLSADDGANGSVAAIVAGANGTVSYLWTSGSTIFGTTSVVGGLFGGTYNVTVADSALINCSASTSVVVSSTTWLQYAFECEKEAVFTIRKTITGVVAPINASYYDSTAPSAYRDRVYISSTSDFQLGNVSWFDPRTATTTAHITHYSGIKANSLYASYHDKTYNRIYFVGTNVNTGTYTGLLSYDIPTNTHFMLPYGSNTEYERQILFVTSQYIYGNVPSLGTNGGFARFDRPTLNAGSTATTITPTDPLVLPFIHAGTAIGRYGGIVIFEVGSNLWIAAGSGNISGDIGIVDASFNYVNTISLPEKSTYYSTNYWNNSFYDTDYNLFYSNDIGSGGVSNGWFYVISANTNGSAGTVIRKFNTTSIRQNSKKYAFSRWAIDSVSNKLYVTFAIGNDPVDANSSIDNTKTYEIDRSTGEFVRLLYKISIGSIIQVNDGLSNSLLGVYPGDTWWTVRTTPPPNNGYITFFNNSIAGDNTSWLNVTVLQKYINQQATGIFTANTLGNPYYIPPYISTTSCPVTYTFDCPSIVQSKPATSGSYPIYYEFGLANKVANNPAITKITASVINSSASYTASTNFTPPFVNYYTGQTPTSVNNSFTYQIRVEYFTGSSVSVSACTV